MAQQISRRRFITISASAAGLPLISGPVAAAANTGTLRHWQGSAMGAHSEILLNGPDQAETDLLLKEIHTEIRRLEGVFSLYKGNSAINRLNRDGSLSEAPWELVQLLQQAKDFASLTNGAFDPSIQPLWQLYAETGSDMPISESLRQKVLELVDHQAITIDHTAIRFEKPGMAITLNGIAQGYITDRIRDRLKAGGMGNCLVHLGEFGALGGHPSGRSWQVGIENPANPGSVLLKQDLAPGKSLATSGGYGTRFQREGINHLLDPATGLAGRHYDSLTVLANSAAAADALSTGFSLMPEIEIRPVLERLSGVRAILIRDGNITRI